MDDSRLVDALRTLYGESPVMSLATIDADGAPHAANVYFVVDDQLDLLYVSDTRSAHALHTAKRPVVAATIYPHVDEVQEIRGVQLRGEVHPIASAEWANVWGSYKARFPFVEMFEQLVREQQFYRLRPHWLRYIDNRVQFGFRRETDWPLG
jgi:uncharacterized protein YhbP (UPF0306 family)